MILLFLAYPRYGRCSIRNSLLICRLLFLRSSGKSDNEGEDNDKVIEEVRFGKRLGCFTLLK